jgi:hypothetical protein
MKIADEDMATILKMNHGLTVEQAIEIMNGDDE